MSIVTIPCDQAVFTSIRSPMGEGYRIVSASSGLRTVEKQVITRNSPSHGSLCGPVDGPRGGPPGTPPGRRAPQWQTTEVSRYIRVQPDAPVRKGNAPAAISFYTLPTHRYVVAISCAAGAEHTGRGGERVYTHNLIMSPEDLARCGYSPFRTMRAMVHAGMLDPQLKPPKSLAKVDLMLDLESPEVMSPFDGSVQSLASPEYVLGLVLEQQAVVVNLSAGWLGAAEALLMGIPGPMRGGVSFCAGLRFSVHRSHVLQVTHDDPRRAEARTRGRRVEIIRESDERTLRADAPLRAWISMVGRHWRENDLTGLSRRSSKPYADTSVASLDRLGAMFNEIDDMPRWNLQKLLAATSERLTSAARHRGGKPRVPAASDWAETSAEGEVLDEWLRASRCRICDQVPTAFEHAQPELWSALVAVWRLSPSGTQFAQPIVAQILRSTARRDPARSARMALDVANPPDGATDLVEHSGLIEHVLRHLCVAIERAGTSGGRDVQPAGDSRVEGGSNLSGERSYAALTDLCQHWLALRPDCPIVADIIRRVRIPTLS